NSQRTSSYIIIQDITGSDPVRTTDSETLQCSVFSVSGNTTCSEEPSVFWFRARSDTSHPDIIYTDGNCEKTSNNQKKCSYKFSNIVSLSKADTFYCAVATCGQILFGNGKNLQIQGSSLRSHKAIIIIFLSAAFAISLTGMAVLCSINRHKCGHHHDAVNLEKNCGQNRQQRDEDRRMYSAAIFTMKTDNTETLMIFAAVKPFSL
ncbi:hypothetical protein GOODEAATRI_027620, partial [Goodea atripinnis]